MNTKKSPNYLSHSISMHKFFLLLFLNFLCKHSNNKLKKYVNNNLLFVYYKLMKKNNQLKKRLIVIYKNSFPVVSVIRQKKNPKKKNQTPPNLDLTDPHIQPPYPNRMKNHMKHIEPLSRRIHLKMSPYLQHSSVHP